MINNLSVQGEQHFDEYIMVAPGSDYGRAMWSDIGCLENAQLLDSAMDSENKLLRAAHHAHFSFGVNRRIQLPFQNMWKKYYSLEKVCIRPERRYCIIFTDISAGRTDAEYLKNLSAKPNVSLVMILVNTMARMEGILRSRFPYFDKVFTFDNKDAEKYGFIHHGQNYSVTSCKRGCSVKFDAFFVGVAKERLKTLTAIYVHIKRNGGSAAFFISGVKKNLVKNNGIRYNQWVEYKDVLKYIAHSNCIVEVVDDNQEGMTLRAMEAICYNKRLLTNNKAVENSPFYKSGFIKVFSSVKDIDMDFVKDRSPVDYHYNNEFSPIHFIEHINQEFLSGEKI